MGPLHRDLEDWDKASDYFEKAQTLVQAVEGPDSMSRWAVQKMVIQNERAHVFLALASPEQALKELAEAISLSRETAQEILFLTRRLKYLGNAHHQLGQRKKARTYWESALETCHAGEKENDAIRRERALLLLYLDRPDEAKPLIERFQDEKFGGISFWREVHQLMGRQKPAHEP